MLSDKHIADQKKHLEELGNRLGYEVAFSRQFIEESNRPDIEKKWMSSVMASCNYGAFLIKILISGLNEYRHLPEEQLGFYIGKIAIQPFLEIINSFEQITNQFIDENQQFKTILDERVKEKISLLEENWENDSKGKSKKLKSNLIFQLKHKIHEMAFIRDTLRKRKIIDNEDYEILSFAWTIRNSMHFDFTAIRDINFSYPDIKTGKVYHFNFSKGQELYHPVDLLSYYVITEQIIFIHLKILQRFSTVVQTT